MTLLQKLQVLRVSGRGTVKQDFSLSRVIIVLPCSPWSGAADQLVGGRRTGAADRSGWVRELQVGP